jgi:hypothetical protein
MAIKNKRNNPFCSKNQDNYSGSSSNNTNLSNSWQQHKNQGKKKNKSSAAYEAITCWFCDKTGHMEIDCRLRLRQNKPLTRKKEMKFKFQTNNIMPITDFGDMDDARDWWEKPGNQIDQIRLMIFSNGFSNGFYKAPKEPIKTNCFKKCTNKRFYFQQYHDSYFLRVQFNYIKIQKGL